MNSVVGSPEGWGVGLSDGSAVGCGVVGIGSMVGAGVIVGKTVMVGTAVGTAVVGTAVGTAHAPEREIVADM